MSKKVVIFSIVLVIFIILVILFVTNKINILNNKDKIIFEKKDNDEYVSIIYQDKEYVPYSTISPTKRGEYLGYVGEDIQDKIYTFKGYPQEEWLISYLDSGLMNDCMLLKEKNVTNIPEGLSSEYTWNNNLDITEKENSMEKNNINVIIDGKNYNLILEDNETVKSLIKLLPLEIYMKELNGNEKYCYLNDVLPQCASVPNRIEKGDVMLYQNNCLVIFYKSFNTNYSYTKIGHIEYLDELESSDVNVKLNLT